MTRRTTPMDAGAVRARAAQANAFLASAKLHEGNAPADNSVAATAAVNAGIAASDAICGHSLGYCSKGEDHDQAIELLAVAVRDAGPSRNLARLLGAKSLASYSASMLSDSKTADLIKYAERLVSAMNDRLR